MNEANQAHLFSSYPLLYRGHDRKSLSNPMQFGFACGDGWFRIIDELSAKAEKIITEMMNAGTPTQKLPKAVQVKEKFGRLTIAMANAQGTGVDDLMSEAAAKAEETCMRCGASGSLRQTDYLATLCDSCYQQPGSRQNDG